MGLMGGTAGGAYPPGPRSRIPGRLELRFLRDPQAFMRDLATYGQVAHFRFRSTDIYLVTDPEGIKRVLAADHRGFTKSQSMQESKRVLGEGLLTSEGDLHHRQRRLVQPAFHHGRVEAYAATMAELAEAEAASWRDGETRDLHTEMSELTVRILSKTLFSTDLDGEAPEIVEALARSIPILARMPLPLADVWERLPLPSSRRFASSLERLDRASRDIIERRRRDPDGPDDLLTLLFDAQRNGNGAAIDDRLVRDETMTILLAGHETTANLLTWTWYLLSQHPDVEARLHAELDEVLGDRPPTLADLPGLVYTGRILSEALRLYPPVWAMGRRAIVDHELDAYAIRAGSIVALNPYVMHHDPRFFPDPFRFDPDRWTDEERRRRPKYAYFPFGGGPRLCLGESFAWIEARLVVAALARRWRLRLAPGHRVRPAPGLTLRPKHGLRMVVERRERPRPVRRPRGPTPGDAAQRPYWDAAAGLWRHARAQALWRRHSDSVNTALVKRWLPAELGRVLKTDLWDEAVGEGLVEALAARARETVGVDVSDEVVAAARARHPSLAAERADVRNLSFEDESFDAVVSNSTLDHFDSSTDILTGLREVHRVLRPGGVLVLTLDNPANPLVALSKALPRRALNRLWLRHGRLTGRVGLLPYYVGATVGRRQLVAMLRLSGFDVRETEAVVHFPRVVASLVGAGLARTGSAGAGERFLRLLAAFERLAGGPARFRTGHFVAVRAVRR
jgi:cytochrome P450/ubiquinone/menaquinone biosynthesis C-methylase UbiE